MIKATTAALVVATLWSGSAWAETERLHATEPASDGVTLYVGGNAASIADADEPFGGVRLGVTVPLEPWLMVDVMQMFHWVDGRDHRGEQASALGSGTYVGLRVAPALSSWRLRPYAALRLVHFHYFPDLWTPESDTDPHGTAHRWGGNVGLGVAVVPSPTSRWRVSFDADLSLFDGPGSGRLASFGLSLGFAI